MGEYDGARRTSKTTRECFHALESIGLWRFLKHADIMTSTKPVTGLKLVVPGRAVHDTETILD